MKLYFYRFALYTAGTKFEKLPERWHHWQYEFKHPEIGSVALKGFPFQPVKRTIKQLVRASCSLRYFPKVTQSKVVIPKKERQVLESEIVHASNLVSLGLNSRIAVTTPLGLEVAFLPYDNEARRWMSKIDSMLVEEGMKLRFSGVDALTNISNDLNPFRDRLDGLSLIAEALSSSHTTGRFHEFIRLFERAFKSSGGRLTAPLFSFLEVSGYNFSHDEVNQWIDLRDSATHADRRNTFSTAAEITPIIGRMEQAAYDVLCNKANWRSDDSARRNLFVPTSGIEPSTSSSAVFVQSGTSATLHFQPIDCFGAFQYDSQVVDPQVFAKSLTVLPKRNKNE